MPGVPGPESAAEYEARQIALNRDDEARAASQFAWTKKQREEREARRISGMGFFRLVWIVAFGILLAQAIAAVVVAVVRALSGTP